MLIRSSDNGFSICDATIARYISSTRSTTQTKNQTMRNYYVLFLLFFLLNTKISFGQSGFQLINAINKQALEIPSFTDDDSSELAALGDILKDKKVIGLGEATHGTREFFVYKAKLIRYLIKNHNLKLVLFESNMSGLDGLNNYIQNKTTGDLNTVIKQSWLFSIYRTQEVADLIEWIRIYNQNKPEYEKVRFGGIDMHYTYYIINDILKKTGLSKLLTQQQKDALINLNKLWQKGEPKLNSKQKSNYLALTSELYKLIKKQNIGDSSSIYKQDIRLLEQSIMFNNRPDIPANKIRDKFMAENIIWAAARTAPNQKVAVWAHNGHISHGLYRNYKAMGVYLKQKYKTKYYALGLLVGVGYARLWNSRSPTKDYQFYKSPLPNIKNTDAIEYTLKQAKYANFFLDLSSPALEETIKDFMSLPHMVRVAGAQVVPSEQDVNLKINVQKSFDGILFFRNTTEAIGI
ncbi:erythromycin esterase family protein [Pedobacter panaciterrae]